jgi:hypothetical protein
MRPGKASSAAFWLKTRSPLVAGFVFAGSGIANHDTNTHSKEGKSAKSS